MVLGIESIGLSTLLIAVSMEQHSNSKTTYKPSWYLMQRGRFGEALLGRAEKRQQWECGGLGKMD